MKEEKEKRSLINKFLSGEIPDNELDSLKTWLSEDPVNRRIFDEENEIWHESGLKLKHEYFNPEKGWSEVTSRVGLGKDSSSSIIILKKNSFRLLIAAASIALLFAVGSVAFWRSENSSPNLVSESSTTVQTFEGEKAHIILADSSTVVLNSGTTVEYSNDFNIKERKIKLSGEAFFDVITDPAKPFVVQIQKMSIIATGTRFNVLSYNNEDRIETTLEEGIIRIAIAGKDSLQVKPGQQVVYFTRSNMAIIRDVPAETYTSWKENMLKLKDTPLEEALRRIARRYNVVFEIRNSELLELKYTATFIDESIEDVMMMLKAVSPINYKIINRTTKSDSKYLKPKIILEKRKINNMNYENSLQTN